MLASPVGLASPEAEPLQSGRLLQLCAGVPGPGLVVKAYSHF